MLNEHIYYLFKSALLGGAILVFGGPLIMFIIGSIIGFKADDTETETTTITVKEDKGESAAKAFFSFIGFALMCITIMGCTAYGGKEYYETKETRYDVLKASNYLKLEGYMHYKSSSFLGTGRSEFMMEFEEKNKFNFYYEENGVVKHMELDYDFPIKQDTEGEAYMIKKIKYTKMKHVETKELKVVDEEENWELHVPKDYFEENGGVTLN